WNASMAAVGPELCYRGGAGMRARSRVAVGSQAAASDELCRDDVALDLVRALAEDHQRCITEVPLDVVVGGVAVGAMHPHRGERVLHGGLGGEQLGHAGL